jgi:penicillin-binding protein 1A
VATSTRVEGEAPRFSLDLHRVRNIRWRHALLVALLAIALVAVVPPLRRAAAITMSRGILWAATPLAPSISGFDRLPETTRILAADGTVIAELDKEKRLTVRLDDLPDHVTHAVLAAEDETFYQHSGVEPTAVFRALVRTAQGDPQGGSTITQQLAKTNYTTRERTVFRKLRELLYATRLEREFSKDELFERYLNQVYFGEGSYGIGAAARAYFGATASELTPGQAAFLAGRIRSPESVDVRKDPDAGVERRNQVLANMAQEGWIDDDDNAIADEPLELAAEAPADAARAPHFVEFVKREAMRLEALGGTREGRSEQLFTGGYTIETTLDVEQFDAATAAVEEMLSAPDDPAVAVVTVEPGDGAIRNLFGGLTFERKFDVATQGRRQPGSAFKPFVYLAALREGIDPRSTFDAGSPQTFDFRGEAYEVNNYEGEGFGEMTVDDALVHSVNTVYVGLGLEAGPPAIVRTALDAHAPNDEDAISAVASVALGGLRQGVTPLEMAAAYAAFAAEGTYAEPYAIARIRDRDDRVVYKHRRQTEEVFDAVEVGVLNNPMQRVVKEGTGRGADIARPLAGKTGTTQDYGDAWFVGYVPQLATAVWVGHPSEIRPMVDVHGRRVSGGSFPASIFQRTMEVAVAGMPVEPIATASPDQLNLERVFHASTMRADTTPLSSTTRSSTTTTTTGSTTTTRRPPTTTTTTENKRPSTTTTTTTESTTTTSSTTTSSSTTTTTTAPAESSD